MQQLVELSSNYDKFTELNTEVVAVFREEQDGREGLSKSRTSGKTSFPLLLDPGGGQTDTYSRDSFTTYIIDPAGKIRDILPGSKMRRPKAELVLQRLQQATDNTYGK